MNTGRNVSPKWNPTINVIPIQPSIPQSTIASSLNDNRPTTPSRLMDLNPSTASKISVPISSMLTIYSQSGHIIQTFPRGTKTIQLPKSAEIASIVSFDSNNIIVPFSYIPEMTLQSVLTDRATGEKVDAVVIKDGQSITGKIVGLSDDGIVLASNNKITSVRKYDQLTVNISDDYTRPHVILSSNNSDVTISYLLSNIAWTCVGTALIDEKKNIMYLRLTGNIVNNTESDIAANTTLVSGEVYQYRSKQNIQAAPMSLYRLSASMQESTSMSSRKVSTSMLEDYTKYNVGNRIIHNKDIAELGTSTVKVIKMYIHMTSDNDKVRYGYRFTADGFVPSCSINVYSIGPDNRIGAYLGTNEIDEGQKGEDIDILIGESTTVQCKSLVMISDVVVQNEEQAKLFRLPLDTFLSNYKRRDDLNWHIITEDLNVEIINYNDKPAPLVLKHYVGDKMLIETRCQDYKKRENGYIEWYFQVPPKVGDAPRKETFKCQILTASYS